MYRRNSQLVSAGIEEDTNYLVDNQLSGKLLLDPPDIFITNVPYKVHFYSVKLSVQPVSEVVISLVTTNSYLVVSKPRVVFNYTNWSIPQWIQVR